VAICIKAETHRLRAACSVSCRLNYQSTLTNKRLSYCRKTARRSMPRTNTLLCACLCYYVACKWRCAPFVMLILNNKQELSHIKEIITLVLSRTTAYDHE